jgi:hypothetical protein
MRSRKNSQMPASLARVSQRFIAWRKARVRGERIPATLWISAAEVAAEHGLNLTARTLKLDYYSLKKRMHAAPGPERSFVELPSSALSMSSECVIEWEDRSGCRMRVHIKGQAIPDLPALGRSFWDAD